MVECLEDQTVPTMLRDTVFDAESFKTEGGRPL
jgi:hypothetical protein